MAFKQKGWSAFTQKTEDIIPQSKDKSARTVGDMTPQSQLHKISTDELESRIDATYENEYTEAKDAGDTGKVKVLRDRMKKYKREIESRGGKYESGYEF